MITPVALGALRQNQFYSLVSCFIKTALIKRLMLFNLFGLFYINIAAFSVNGKVSINTGLCLAVFLLFTCILKVYRK